MMGAGLSDEKAIPVPVSLINLSVSPSGKKAKAGYKD
jgi:hypothetical protein